MGPDVKFFDTFRGNEFVGSGCHCFVFLAVCAGEDNDLAAHLRCKLDSKMSQSSYSDYTNAVCGSRTEGL
jgi:hypothetical protein